MKHASVACTILLLCASCVKDELPVPAHADGDAAIGQACIGTDYASQVWYDLGTNSAVRTNSKMLWDLAFECGADGWRVRLNGARFMRALPLATTDITQALDTTGFAALWKVDQPSGAPDSTAMGDWRVAHPAIALDLGYAVNGLPLGLKQLRVESVDAAGYSFRIANADGSGVQVFTIGKSPTHACVYFSITSGSQVEVAPSTGSYDLVFTQYTHRFTDPPMAYLVTGVVNGFSGARVAELTADFATVTLADTLAHPFSSAEDAVGYDWKEYDFDAGVYSVFPDHVYIVQDAQGWFYKLHFIDFYNDLGERGCPTFEVQAW